MKTAIAKFSGYSSIFVTFKEAKILFKKKFSTKLLNLTSTSPVSCPKH